MSLILSMAMMAAAAQPARPAVGSPEEQRIVLAKFARCTVDRREKQVRTALTMPMGAGEETAIGRLMTWGECWPRDYTQDRYTMTTLTARGALFAELYRRANPVAPTGGASAMLTPVALPAASARAEAHRPLVEFGACVARADLENGWRFVVAAPGSADENAAFAALRPALGGCLPQGTQLRLNRLTLENGLAEALYGASAGGR